MSLEVRALEVAYANVRAVDRVSLSVRTGSVVCVLGSNGAGKSSLLKCIVGLVPAAGGQVTWEGEDITNLPPQEITRRGITLSPEGRRLFPELTVKENLLMGGYLRRRDAEFRADLELVYQHFPRLRERQRQLAGSLSGGEQQMCAIGRALMSEPTVLMLDEPSLGLAPVVVEQVMGVVAELHRAGTTVLLVEQNLRKALEIAQRGTVIETGRVRLRGTSAELSANPEIRSAYLGI